MMFLDAAELGVLFVLATKVNTITGPSLAMCPTKSSVAI
jgi:hypothetical protein